MPSSSSFGRELEIAHVLYLDLVGYSRLPMPDQQRLVVDLNAVVRGCFEFRRAEAAGELMPLPTGDGMALVFLRDPEAPVRCALEISRRASERPGMQLRMGVHSGPVYPVQDINANRNVAGGGVNIAQRVMDCSAPGQILLSNTVVELLGQVREWPLDPIGEREVKHELRLRLYNLRTDLSTPPAVHDPQLLDARPSGAPTSTGHVALLYKRNAVPDERLVTLLQERLVAAGFPVFTDRHMMVGVEWAREIEHQVRTAAAVVPLVSEAALPSEMLAYEIQIAHESAQQQAGRPMILPVRVVYQGPLPEPLAGVLDPLQAVLWRTPDDDERVVREIFRALRGEARETPVGGGASAQPIPPEEFEAVGGAVPLGSRFYIYRPADAEFLGAIARRDSIVLVKGARQMGKTSLLARGLQAAREGGARVGLTDLQKLNASHFGAVDGFLMALAEMLADQLDLGVFPDEVWNPRRSPNTNFERYLRREVLGRTEPPLVWGLDEVDRLFTCPFGSEVFGLFRSWHNERSLDPAGPWSKLTLAIAYATEAHLFITDVNQSPFNVGTRLALEDFSFGQIAELNQRHGAPLNGEAEVARFARLVAGHPYLVRRGLHEMVTRDMEIGTFEREAARDEGPFGDHLRRMLVLLARDPVLEEALRAVLRGQPCPSTESFYRLRSAGVVLGTSARDARPRCQVYATYLEQHLLR